MTLTHKPFKKEVLIPTKDDWYPSYLINGRDRYVRVFVLQYLHPIQDGLNFKVGAWGNDDFGLEREFHTKEEALEVYNQLIVMENISKDELKLDFGFDVL